MKVLCDLPRAKHAHMVLFTFAFAALNVIFLHYAHGTSEHEPIIPMDIKNTSQNITLSLTPDLTTTPLPMTTSPTMNPIDGPSSWPTRNPTADPSSLPSINPTGGPNPSPTINQTADPSFLSTINPTDEPSPSPTRNSTVNPTSSPTKSPAAHLCSRSNTGPEPSELEFYTNVHNSLFPVKQAGEWLYKPGIQAIHPSPDHLICLDQESQGNCHDEDAWKITNDKAKLTRHNSITRNAISNSPGILSANDPWVWQSHLPQYQVLSNEDTVLYKKQLGEVLQNRKIYLVGDSLTRQWSQVMRCELVHVLGMSLTDANKKVKFVEMRTGFRRDRIRGLKNTKERDIVVFNLGHHVGWKLSSNWTDPYRGILNDALTFPFGKIPDSNIFYRTTSVRHFRVGAGDWDTNSSKSGSVEPEMDGKWSFYGGNRPEQPTQNLIAFEVFLDARKNNCTRKIQILDTSPIMLARGDATFDGTHFCLPGPMQYWSQMLYHRLLQN